MTAAKYYKVKHCFDCGKEIVFDDFHVTSNNKHIPLTASTRRPHRCPKKPFNKQTRKKWWEEQQRKAEQERARRYRETYEEWQREQQYKKQEENYSYKQQQRKYRDILGLGYGILSEDIVKSHFRKLMLLYHPDRNHAPDAQEKTRLIIEAFENANNNISLE